jgi:hypothetical protein
MNIGKMKAGIKLGSNAGRKNFTIEEREGLFHEFMKGQAAKNHLTACLNSMAINKTDVLTEIMTQYAMHKGEMATYDFDSMSVIFDEEIESVRKFIQQGRYDSIYGMGNLAKK